MQVGRASLLATEDGGALFAVSVFSHATAYVYNVTRDSWGQTGTFVERSESYTNKRRTHLSCRQLTELLSPGALLSSMMGFFMLWVGS